MSSAQAGELLHRRHHKGVSKTRALHHITRDAPKNICSAPIVTCADSAAASSHRTSYNSTLDTPAPTPGSIRVDIQGPFTRSIGSYLYAAFFVDEHMLNTL
uniref:Uncharacterized protein n=1 Tax=Coccolithus braarudii TaxID=221442 RepID=A0A7S0L344_9EUKA